MTLNPALGKATNHLRMHQCDSGGYINKCGGYIVTGRRRTTCCGGYNLQVTCNGQATNHLLRRCGGAELLSSTLSVFALLVAAMVHDAGHDGLNNIYHQAQCPLSL